jgi:hypothetical protein
MGSINYKDSFITVAADCPAATAEEPDKPGSIASVQYRLLKERPPYTLTSDDLLFETEKKRKGLAGTDAERAAFFAKSQACLRASPLPKRYGWGIHHDAEGKIALIAQGSEDYRRLAACKDVKVVPAMRNRKAR